ncbi:MAG: hypothetical protein HRT66_10400 [Flavobacteriaceae bacterium]|nr:hypothetical protein [Flavobacteriaceae bacterium]
MRNLKEMERLRKLHNLIKSGNTGTPKELAMVLSVCESHIYNILEDLKEKGFPIKYSKSLKSYVYNSECELEIEFSVILMTEKETINIAGGSILLSHSNVIRV